jgi:hypothetical protein
MLTTGAATVTASFAALACSWTPVLNNNSSTRNIFSIAASGTTILAGPQQLGLQRSTDNGTTWSDLFVGGSYVNTVYQFGTHVLAGSSGTSSGIYVSSDAGATWTQPVSGTLVQSIASSGTTLYAGTAGAGVMSSTDNGSTWTPDLSTDLTSTTVYSVVVSGSTIYAGTGNGLYYQAVSGEYHWHNVSAVPSYSVWALSTIGGYVFAGTGTGIYRLNNNTGTWSTAKTDTTTYSFVVSGNYLFAGTENGVCLSSNNGDNWSPVNGGLPGGSALATSLAVNSTSIFMVTGDIVYRSPLP